MEKMIKSWTIHALHIAVLITPCKRLFADDGVDGVQFRNIRVIHKLTVLEMR